MTDQDAPAVWQVGEHAYCRVHACRGWYVVTAVKGPAWDQRIKVAGVGTWNPAYNFSRHEPRDGS